MPSRLTDQLVLTHITIVTNFLTQKVRSWAVSVLFGRYPQPDNHTVQTTDTPGLTPGFKPFTMLFYVT